MVAVHTPRYFEPSSQPSLWGKKDVAEEAERLLLRCSDDRDAGAPQVCVPTLERRNEEQGVFRPPPRSGIIRVFVEFLDRYAGLLEDGTHQPFSLLVVGNQDK